MQGLGTLNGSCQTFFKTIVSGNDRLLLIFMHNIAPSTVYFAIHQRGIVVYRKTSN